jgi:lipopolysaccharide export system permease protein
VEAADGLHVLLFDGSRQEVEPQTGRLNILTFHENLLDLSSPTHSQTERVMGMSEVSLGALLHPPTSLSRIDQARWIAEAHKRMTAPLSAVTYALLALLSVLTGAFRRHASILRPLISVGGVVALLALSLALQTLAARDNATVPVLWVETIVPPLVFAIMLFGPQVLAAWRQPLPRIVPGLVR